CAVYIRAARRAKKRPVAKEAGKMPRLPVIDVWSARRSGAAGPGRAATSGGNAPDRKARRRIELLAMFSAGCARPQCDAAPRWIPTLVLLAALALALPLGGVEAEARALPDTFADLAESLVPAVVNISTTQAMPQKQADHDSAEAPEMPPGSPFDEFSFNGPGDRSVTPGQRGAVHSLGSGFVVDPSGLIVTNNHVIAGAEEITVILPDDTSLKAQIVGRDTVTDLA